ncbi:right-handed parallel beta-helix repeat-containing protein [Amycolatopsis magusensis]|uniref:right-handed parallel beta-helix repeat-containing protein n=1 Tax=Amycolatopsis magusensis TaxID=882444 RepID=UPI0024A95F5D|nr:right-handed parallel beta-helix repeat-containing protein [Amycolatopsis magusensis]MDI5979274.1 right-handed parallel beta-helix repeat-containing protein [Amycolatopsis magusensis]
MAYTTEVHLALDGDDGGPGTPDRPFATIDRARRAAREAAGDVVVHVRAGTYPGPWEFTEEDSARDGSRITYQAHGFGTPAQDEVVIGGGRVITGWRVGGDGVWVADVGTLDTRHLTVDGRRVERAAIDGIPGEVSENESGYVTDARLDWRAGVEFVHRGVYPWTEARLAVESVADGTITMKQPAFSWARQLYNYSWEGQTSSGPGLPTRVENDPSFLTEPGTFALDRSRPGEHVLHYLPRTGEDPAVTRVVAPERDTLLVATGAGGLSFRGLVFADTTWLRPTGDRGFLHYHGSGFHDGGRIDTVVVVEGQSWLTVTGEPETIPACASLVGTTGIRFEGCRFTRLGSTALGVTGGADTVVRACEFDTLAAGAITLTGTHRAVVEDNEVHRVGLDHSGSPGIALLDTVDCTVAHNRVDDVPHCGIVGGPAKGTRILHNHVTGSMGVLADGGGIYVSGPQGESHEDGAVVRGNVVTDTRTPYNFALYTDYGAAWVTVADNVVRRADNTAVLQVHPPLNNVIYRGNVWDADPVGSDAVPGSVTYENNTTLTDAAALDAAESHTQAGPRHP